MMTTTTALEGCLLDSLIVTVATTTTHGSEFVFLSLFVGLRSFPCVPGSTFAHLFAPLISPALDDPSVPLGLSILCGFLGLGGLPGGKRIFLAS
jgi:hypothetical protein